MKKLFLCLFVLIPYWNFAQTLDQRVDSLLNLMTLQEKIDQLANNGFMTTPANTRLNIPGFQMADGPHGYRFQPATNFPVGIAMMATWDKTIAYRIGKGMGEEFQAFSTNIQLGPCIDIQTDPRNGRTAESGGEDTYLSGQMGYRIVQGIQTTSVMATIKHFNFEGIQNNRMWVDYKVSKRDLNEVFGYHFRKAIQDGGSFSIMSSYNLINGLHASDNKMLLDTILRQRWGFPFFVMSDWDAVKNTKQSIQASTDLCMGSDHYKNDLANLISSGQILIEDINKAVRNELKGKYLSGMFDPNYPTGNIFNANSADHKQICLDAARKTVILLKNQSNILPLNKTAGKKIALIGPSAAVAQINCYGSSEVFPPYAITIQQGILSKIPSANLTYVMGCAINSTDTSGYAAALAAAAKADYVIFAGGLDATQEGEGYGAGGDRTGGLIELPGKQQDLINKLAKINPNIIVILQSGGICSIPSCVTSIKGLLYAFYPGQEGGNAIADVVFGDYNPAGRLPVTMPVSTSQLPPWNSDLLHNYNLGYRYFDETNKTPQYPFGFGLSYTTFAYSNIVVAPLVDLGKNVIISVDVQNTGAVAGEEVVQLYLSKDVHTYWLPKKQLKGFDRIALAAGQKTTYTFTLTAEDMYVYDTTANTYMEDLGAFSVRVGGSSDNLPLTGHFTVNSAAKMPDLQIANIYSLPKYPKAGDKVVFLATVKNYGTAATTKGAPVKLVFSVNGQDVSWNNTFSDVIPVGGMKMICVNAGPNGTMNWTVPGTGTYTFQGRIDADNAVTETYEDNNLSATKQINIVSNVNIAYKKPVTVSSEENATNVKVNINDENDNTRWASLSSDNQWAIIDLQNKYQVDKIDLNFEAAYASEYVLLISNDGIKWDTIKHVFATGAGHHVFDISVTGRYLKFQGIKRGSAYGYSMYEFRAYGSLLTTTGIDVTDQDNQDYIIAPNPASTNVHVFAKDNTQVLKIVVYNILGQIVYTNSMDGDEININVSGFDKGIYFLNVQNDNTNVTNKIIIE